MGSSDYRAGPMGHRIECSCWSCAIGGHRWNIFAHTRYPAAGAARFIVSVTLVVWMDKPLPGNNVPVRHLTPHKSCCGPPWGATASARVTPRR